MNHQTLMWQLGSDLHKIFQKHLQKGLFDRGALWLEVLLLLNHGHYQKHLLFDYGEKQQEMIEVEQESVVEEAMIYLDGIINRRLRISNNSQLTSLHELFAVLCRMVQAEGWQETQCLRIKAKHQAMDSDAPPQFQYLQRAMEQQVRKSEGDVSEHARQCQRSEGGSHLQTEHGSCKIPEEMMLICSLDAIPTPLMPASNEDDYALRNRLIRVVDALNAPYAALRSCGLVPSEWLPRMQNLERYKDGITVPSIDQLNKLAKLKRRAGELAWQQSKPEPCWREAFEKLLAGQKRYAKFGSFTEFSQDEIGVQMMRLNRSLDVEDDPEIEALVVEDSPEQDAIVSQTVFKAFPEHSLEHYAASWLLIQHRTLVDLLHDPNFKSLATKHSTYAEMPIGQIQDKLPAAIVRRMKRKMNEEKQHDPT